ncbi:anti-sigma factor [Sciscionella marina]|uniref:anti-sigma factor n=1 Tax=Sciscionella marina TaxID=508770 RepID=UPI00037BE7C7|nr:anti-sigma factor [Sciscionella marina]
MNPDVHTLTGAYALDALDDLERASFERHLAECPDCAREVREFQETAARLGAAAAVTTPQRLRERVLAEVARTRQFSPAGPRAGRARPGRWTMRITGLVAAAAVIAAAVLGVDLWQTGRDLSGTQSRLAEISTVVNAPDAKSAKGTASNGGTATAVVAPSERRAVLVVAGMPPAPADRAYQLWFMGGGKAYSAGLLRRDDRGGFAPVLAATVPGAEQVGLTLEPSGGSPQPTTQPLMAFRLA